MTRDPVRSSAPDVNSRTSKAPRERPWPTKPFGSLDTFSVIVYQWRSVTEEVIKMSTGNTMPSLRASEMCEQYPRVHLPVPASVLTRQLQHVDLIKWWAYWTKCRFWFPTHRKGSQDYCRERENSKLISFSCYCHLGNRRFSITQRPHGHWGYGH